MGINLKTLSQVSQATGALRSQQHLSKSALKSIKPGNIGYICPDGTINFQSTKTAEEFANSARQNQYRQ